MCQLMRMASLFTIELHSSETQRTLAYPKTGQERIFDMYKFRSMSNERDENGELLPDDIRLGKFGKALRATSLDELPEAFNILKGDMSIIGPDRSLFGIWSL